MYENLSFDNGGFYKHQDITGMFIQLLLVTII